jgi:hypothetical protein
MEVLSPLDFADIRMRLTRWARAMRIFKVKSWGNDLRIDKSSCKLPSKEEPFGQ